MQYQNLTDKSPLLSDKPPLKRSHVRGDSKDVVIVIHGGAGTMSKAGSTPEQREAYKAALASALRTGYAVLEAGGEAMDAAVAAVVVLEDNPLFNAGKGAVFNTAGKNELEASLMLSKPPSSYPDIPPTRRGAGLTLLTRARNPSKVARALYLTPSLAPHAFLSGSTAEDIGASQGETLVDPSYFFTEHRWREHRRGLGLPEEPLPHHDRHEMRSMDVEDHFPTGTVGAVALDVRGCIASVTSTGGKTNKLPGRIGDTPVMGAGFWAEEWERKRSKSWLVRFLSKIHILKRKGGVIAVGVSGTGDGDYFIRQATASTIARRVRFLGESISDASEYAVKDLLKDGGIGGVIALDNKGRVAMPLNCPGMYRGVIKGDGVPKVAIFADDELEERLV